MTEERMMEFNSFNHAQWKEYIQRTLRGSDVALMRALLLIDNEQTAEEKYERSSIEENGVGFTKVDAKQLTEAAAIVRSGKMLNYDMYQAVLYKMPKYWRQLMRISKKNLIGMMAEKAINEQIQADECYQTTMDDIIGRQKQIAKCQEGTPCEYGICDECERWNR